MMVRVRGPAERRVAFPIVCVRIYYDALHRGGGVVAGSARGFATVMFGNDHTAAVRVEENFAGIEAQSPRGIERPVHPVAVELAGLYSRHERMPVMIGTVGG